MKMRENRAVLEAVGQWGSGTGGARVGSNQKSRVINRHIYQQQNNLILICSSRSVNAIHMDNIIYYRLLYLPPKRGKRAWSRCWGFLMTDAAFFRQHLMKMILMIGRVLPVMDWAESTTLTSLLHTCWNH